MLGFLGPNGAGKSTTMKMLTGFLHPSSGTARVCGFDVAEHPLEAKRRIGYLPEGAPLYPDMTAAGFLDFVADVRGLAGERKRARIAEVVAEVNLQGVLHQRIETLSKGFKRRVGLAQAILHDPEVLILDEPTDGLDPNQKHEVRSLIPSMARDKVIVLSTHILEEVEAVCTRAIIIARGKVVVDGTPAELAARSRWHNAVTLRVPAAGAARWLERRARAGRRARRSSGSQATASAGRRTGQLPGPAGQASQHRGRDRQPGPQRGLGDRRAARRARPPRRGLPRASPWSAREPAS